MKKFILTIIITLLLISKIQAKNIDIKQNLELSLLCKFEKVILKNEKYNFQTFFAGEVNRKNIDLLKIRSSNPETLILNGLSEFLEKNKKLSIKIVNKDIIYFKRVENINNYSESGILTRKTGELIHEITKNINSSIREKEISFFKCKILKDNI